MQILGFGGSCFQKDILNLVYLAESLNLPEVAAYWSQVITINEYQKSRFVNRIIKSLFNNVSGKRIAVLGFAFKKNTGDTRETAALSVVDRLLEEGATVAIYDPVVEPVTIRYDISTTIGRPSAVISESEDPSAQVLICPSAYSAARGAHALVICTEWDEFRSLDYPALYEGMAKPAFLFDGRLVVDPEPLRAIGFAVHTIGRAEPRLTSAAGGQGCQTSGEVTRSSTPKAPPSAWSN